MCNITTFALSTSDVCYAVYEGEIDDLGDTTNCILTIHKAVGNNKISCHIFMAPTNYTRGFDSDILADASYYNSSYECSFTIGGYSFDFDIYPETGTARGLIAGGVFYYQLFNMTGTVDKFYAPYLPYSEDDMKMCMDLSVKD